MANATAVKQELSKLDDKPKSLEMFIREATKELRNALPDHLSPQRIVRIALTCIRTNPELSKCTPESFLGALFTSAQLGIEPIAGRAYLLPFNNNKKKADGSWHSVKEAQFVMGYKGLADLFYRHEKSVQLEWGQVHKNDIFEYEMGTKAFIKHKPAFTDRGEVVAYYVIATLSNGGKVFQVMSKEECMDHGKQHSKTWDKKTNSFYSTSPWNTSPDSMCLKTVLIQLAKLLPLSVELQRAIQTDETSRHYRKGVDDILDVPDSTGWANESVEAEVVKEDSIPVKMPTLSPTKMSDGSEELLIIVESSGMDKDSEGVYFFVKAKSGVVYTCSEKFKDSVKEGQKLTIRYKKESFGNVIVEKD